MSGGRSLAIWLNYDSLNHRGELRQTLRSEQDGTAALAKLYRFPLFRMYLPECLAGILMAWPGNVLISS